jgi:hypothetical protein
MRRYPEITGKERLLRRECECLTARVENIDGVAQYAEGFEFGGEKGLTSKRGKMYFIDRMCRSGRGANAPKNAKALVCNRLRMFGRSAAVDGCALCAEGSRLSGADEGDGYNGCAGVCRTRIPINPREP